MRKNRIFILAMSYIFSTSLYAEVSILPLPYKLLTNEGKKKLEKISKNTHTTAPLSIDKKNESIDSKNLDKSKKNEIQENLPVQTVVLENSDYDMGVRIYVIIPPAARSQIAKTVLYRNDTVIAELKPLTNANDIKKKFGSSFNKYFHEFIKQQYLFKVGAKYDDPKLKEFEAGKFYKDSTEKEELEILFLNQFLNRVPLYYVYGIWDDTIAEILGFLYIDKNYPQDVQNITYRVECFTSSDKSLDKGSKSVSLGTYPKVPVPKDIITNPYEKHIQLSWEHLKEASDILGYYVYQSDTKEGKFERITEDPIIVSTNVLQTVGKIPPVSYSVLNVLPNKKYYFKVSAIHYNRMESELSSVVEGALGASKIPPAPESVEAIVPKTEKDSFKVLINWSVPNFNDIAYYNIYRAVSNDKYIKYNTLPIPKQAQTYTDFGPFVYGKKYYYKVTAVSSKGVESVQSVSCLFNPQKQVRPERITNIRLTPKVASMDILFDTTSDKYLFAYHIYRSSNLGENYIEVATLKGKQYLTFNGTLVYTDQDLDARINYCYKVQAEDYTGFPSEALPPVCAKPANGLQVESPFQLEAIADGTNGITIAWKANVNSLLRGFLLERRDNNKEGNIQIILNINDLYYRDQYLTPGVTYSYRLTSIAKDNVYGKPSKVISFTLPVPQPQPVQNIMTYSTDEGYTFTWNYYQQVDSFKIYIKSVDNSKFKELVFTTKDKSYVWKKPTKGFYEVIIKAVYQNKESVAQEYKKFQVF